MRLAPFPLLETPVLQVDTAEPHRPVAPLVFLSHAAADKVRFVGPLTERLRERGLRVWVDDVEIRPGDSLVGRVFGDGIAHADAVIVVVSEHSARSRWMLAEVEAACLRRIRDGIRIVVICLDDALVPPALDWLHWVDVDPSADWSAQLEQIVWALG